MITLLKNQGFTNKTYKDDENNTFIKIKHYDDFNHKTPYEIISNLDFAPKKIFEDDERLVTEWIDGKTILATEISNEELREIGKLLITLHNSKLPFAKENQIARRFKVYREKISQLGRKIPILDKYYKKINLFLKNIDTSAPVHSDLWLFNFIKTDKNKIYITDWEYATMGDVHFDLAYFLESSNLSEQQEQSFFEGYGDDYEEKYLLVHRIIVNALIVLWINKHKVKPFDDSLYLKRVEKYMKLYLDKYQY
ncbi:phosphotransferase [Mycoplasma phocoeninasale]|uniref:Phosphotransferase n=1 Tax=Mycoplasma phocoeninasale TaxID=2726117 RepID=A0A858U6G0_9MOLU|nr:phosphotransferase [Mycoplasma phocoeninasale]MBN0970564.1 phosphotransferase [Mycoplasma phocoeninasale]QJG66316.1 phosphotransferase [Mycoplasma phocoeninasale]